MDKEPLSKIAVVLIENGISIDSTHTDSLGGYDFSLNMIIENEYSVNVTCYDHANNDIIIHKANDTILMTSYIIEISCYTDRHEKFDNSAYFEYNVIDSVVNFEAQWFKSLLEEYPLMCIEFKQSINPIEKLRIAKKRMSQFRSILNELGCDMSRVLFSDEIILLDDYALSKDNRSRIQGIILSMEGNCD